MYVPEHFRMPVDRVDEVLSGVMVGNLVTVHPDGPRATLVPFVCEQRGEHRHLVAHLVRNNPQAVEPLTGPGLAILDIDDAFVSPDWYATNETSPSVPTWNYLTIHARGPVTIDPTPTAALRVARELSQRAGEQATTDRVGEDKLARMARAIVAVDLRIDELEAKAKMSQNRHPDDVASLLAHLDADCPVLADYLREYTLPHARARFATITDLKNSAAHR